MQKISEISIKLQETWGPVAHLERVKDSEALRKVVKEIEPLKVKFALRLGQSTALFNALNKLRNTTNEWGELDKTQKRIIDLTILDAKLAGVGLPWERKKRFNEIKEELEILQTQFRNNVIDSTKKFKLIIHDEKELDGIPATNLAQFSSAYENSTETDKSTHPKGYLITLSQPDYVCIVTYANNRSLREKMYFAWVRRASEGESDNTLVMSKILILRHEMAGLLDYNNFGELSLATKLVKEVEKVNSFLEELRLASYDAAVQDLEDLREFAKQQGADYELKHWDISYWAEKLREHKFKYSEEELRKYFQYEIVLNGLFDLLNRLYDVKIVKSSKQIDVWHPDVAYYEVYDEDKQEIAGIYIDPYARPAEKTGGAWMDVVNQRIVEKQSDGSLKKQIPIAYLICNGTPPVNGKPSLMTFDEANTLFHEMGHVTQHILTRVDYALVSGISNVEWDAVECPSQYNENWLYDKLTVQKLSKHIETNETLPNELFIKLYNAKQYRAGSDQLRQIHFASIDMSLHTKLLYHSSKEKLNEKIDYSIIGQNAFAMDALVAKKTSVLQPLPQNKFLCSFNHIFAGSSYSAGYYSYKWAEVMSADAFAAIEDVGLENESKVKEIAKKFRDTVLALGGSEDAAEIYKKFRGREPTVDALLKQGGLLKYYKKQTEIATIQSVNS